MNEREIVCEDLNLAIDRMRANGFRLELIYPADDPHTAVVSKGRDAVRLTSKPGARTPCDELPPFAPGFFLTPAGGSPAHGRAGMLYRDLIPSRLGGRYIASHISIEDGGEVADWVHFHRIALQMIYVRRGWVRLVYEDQGDPFVMGPGDLVLQPPGIRHQVLESSSGLEVIEISAPALHATYADHTLVLPNGIEPARRFQGQQFLHHVAADTPWTLFAGGEAQETAIAKASGGIAEVRTIRPCNLNGIEFAGHEGELVFGFVLEGSALLDFPGGGEIGPADAFVVPPRAVWRLSEPSPDFLLLHVTTAQLD